MSAPAAAALVSDAVALTTDPDGLAAIHGAGCAAAVWCRALPSGALAWLDALEAGQLPNGRLVLCPDEVEAFVHSLCEEAMPAGPARDWLVADVSDLARRFCALTRAPRLRVRLERVQTNACRRFHVDAVTMRLVCTYRGAGTQYQATQEGAQLHQVATGAPILLRGTLAIDGDPSLVHRSPPIEGTGQTRLVLVLDPIADPQEAE